MIKQNLKSQLYIELETSEQTSDLLVARKATNNQTKIWDQSTKI